MKAIWRSKTMWGVLVLLLGALGIVGWQHHRILAWYHVRQLTYAYQDNRENCVKRVAALGEVALPRLLEGLHQSDALICDNMQAALGLMAKQWGAGDPRSRRMVEGLHHQFNEFSVAGQEKT